MKLSTRIAVAVGLTVPLLVLAAGALVLGLVTRDLHRQQDARLQDRAAAILPVTRNLLTARRDDRPRAAQNQQRKLFAAALDVGVRLVAGGATVAEGGPQPSDGVPLPNGVAGPVTLRADGRGWRVLSLATGSGAKAGTLWLFLPSAAGRAEVTAVRNRLLLVTLLAAPVSGLLALAVAERATLPLRLLRRRAGSLDPAAGAAGFAHQPSGVAEVDELAGTLRAVLVRYDRQAARRAQALETARSFSAAASHELRTPLMSMRTNLDILQSHPDLGPADRAEVLADLQSEHARVLDLLTALRALARGDLVEADAFTEVDLAETVDSAVCDLARRHPGAVVTTAGPLPEVRLPGWAPGLRILVDNLLANAVVHGRRPGEPARVEVALRRGGPPDAPLAVLTVDDAGPGVPPEERDAVFQRFHRRPGSPGSGLGLTLAAQQAALHGGTIRVLTAPDTAGARFEARLPLTPPRPADGTPAVALPDRRDWLTGTATGRLHDPS